jgi:two-component system chemotaxis response regulator CheB
MIAKPIRVLVIDDSPAIQQLLTKVLTSDPMLEVVGTAQDPYFARDKIRDLKPDVVTLDVEMPRMDGLTFLEKLMQAHPLPVVMVSALTQAGHDVTLRALELGAVDFFPKTLLVSNTNMEEAIREICAKVKAAAHAKVHPGGAALSRPAVVAQGRATTMFDVAHKIIVIGAATGGTEAVRAVLSALPTDGPGVVVVQHMPAGFTTSFAHRMDSLCHLRVKEAQNGDRVAPGSALIAPGNFHTTLVNAGTEFRVQVSSGPPINRHRPSIDVLYESVAEQAGRNGLGVILTGAGDDGALGLRKMRDAGAHTIAQEQSTCVVYEMPQAAIEAGGVEKILPLGSIAAELIRLMEMKSAA